MIDRKIFVSLQNTLLIIVTPCSATISLHLIPLNEMNSNSLNTFHTHLYAIKDPAEISKRRVHTNQSVIGYRGFRPGYLHLTLIRLIQASNTHIYIGNGHVVFCKKIKLFFLH